MSTYALRQRVKADLLTQKNTGRRGPLPTARVVRQPGKPTPPPAVAKRPGRRSLTAAEVARVREYSEANALLAAEATLPVMVRHFRREADMARKILATEVRG